MTNYTDFSAFMRDWILFYCKSKLKNKTGLGDTMTDQGQLTSDDQEKAELLNRHFTSVFTREDTAIVPTLNGRPHNNLTDI